MDDGRPFNPFEVAEPDTSLSIEDRDIGGLGVHLVKNLMDKGPRFECASRARIKNPNTNDWQTVSACNYTAWGN